jgi:ribonuclease J
MAKELNQFSITPLGGVGQIGSNMTLIKGSTETILIDAGILFPREECFDINYLIPDFENLDPIPKTLFITHGHEDHIGCIVHVLRTFPDIKIHAPLFASALIQAKLKHVGLNPFINIYDDHSELSFGEFSFVPIRVNHSIPDTYGVLISHKKLSICAFFVSDFKIDTNSPFESPFDFKKLKSHSSMYKKRILLCDSTNIFSKNNQTPSEASLIPILDEILSHSGRTFATFFSSNIHRLQIFINLAHKYKKKCILYGAALNKYAQIAVETGHLTIPDKTIVDVASVNANKDNLLVLTSGCQGDLRSTFRRIGIGEDKTFKPCESDTFIISSKAIPGNERKLTQILNKISEFGSTIYNSDNHLIHASGHPGKGDIDLLINEFQPDVLIPIHGETYFLKHFREYIQEKFPLIRVAQVLNGFTYDCHSDISSDTHVLEPVMIHGSYIPINKSRISERRKLATRGCVFITLSSNKKICVSLVGLPDIAHDLLPELQNILVDILSSKKLPTDLSDLTRIACKQFFQLHLGYRPETFVHIL